MSEPKRVQEYMTIYRSRLSQAYCRTSSALTEHGIPFEHANSSLFVSIDLSGWLHYFPDSRFSARGLSREIQLCEFLTDHGVFLNAGEVRILCQSFLYFCGANFGAVCRR